MLRPENSRRICIWARGWPHPRHTSTLPSPRVRLHSLLACLPHPSPGALPPIFPGLHLKCALLPNQTSTPRLGSSSTQLRLDYDNQLRPKEASWRLVLTPWKQHPQVLLQVASNSWHAKTENIQIIPTLVFNKTSYPQGVKSLSRASLQPQTVVRQASLSFTISQNLLKLMFIQSVMPSDHLIVCHVKNKTPGFSGNEADTETCGVLPSFLVCI